MLMNIGDRIRQKRVALGLSQAQVAEKCGWENQSRLSHYENGSRQIKIDSLKLIANALNVSPVWLQYGDEPSSISPKHPIEDTNYKSDIKEKYKKYTDQYKLAPLLDWKSILEVHRRKDMFFKDNIPIYNEHPEDAIAIKVRGDAMISDKASISFNDGDLLIVDILQKPTNGRFVVAEVPGKPEAILRQYIIDGGIAYLKALNADYPPLQVNNKMKILGVVREKITFMKT